MTGWQPSASPAGFLVAFRMVRAENRRAANSAVSELFHRRYTKGVPEVHAKYMAAACSPRAVLALIGQTDRARALRHKLLSFAGPLLLYAEEIDATTGEHLGNFPQAFTHLALIEAVSLLIASELEEDVKSAGWDPAGRAHSQAGTA